MGLVQSVAKGYQMLWVIIYAMPSTLRAFLFLTFGAVSIIPLVAIFKWFLEGS